MKIKWSFVLILAGLIYAGVLSFNIYFATYAQKDTVDINLFPKVIGEWKSDEIPVSKEDKAILETDNVFVRKYFNPAGDEVFLFMVYSQHNRKVSHPPEICYTGGGSTITDSKIDTIGEGRYQINVNRLKSERAGQTQFFCYWFKVGDQFTPNYWQQQILIAVKSFLKKPSSSALIRISTIVKNEEPDEAAVERIKNFGKNIFPHIKQYLP
ncbi:MAG: EpsI family protein [Candidatus Omnitrophica bacterium]|nr:EpsI family protein [Candidatus Omnitrophota bacterium]